jgi:hypothetical protein
MEIDRVIHVEGAGAKTAGWFADVRIVRAEGYDLWGIQGIRNEVSQENIETPSWRNPAMLRGSRP